MRAVICRAWGEVEDLTVEDVTPPRPGPDEVLIAVKATAVNYAEALMAEQALAREAMDQALGDRVRASPHFTEGVTAFLHTRPPKYP